MLPVLFRIPIPGGRLPFVGEVGSVPIFSYGVMLGLSLVVGWYLTLGLCERAGMNRERMANCYVVTAVVALIGSRALYLLTNPSDVRSVADVFALRGGGLVAYGGFIGGLVGSWGFLRWRGNRLLPWADAAVPSLATGLFVTRIGCYLFGCDFGRPLSPTAPSWLARLGTFPRWSDGPAELGPGSPAWVEHVQRGLVPPDSEHALPVHPTQLYESLVGIALFGLLMLVRKRQSFRGQVFFVATFAYGVLRFLIEIVRDDPERGQVPWSAPRHFLLPSCLALFAFAFSASMSRSLVPRKWRHFVVALAFVPAAWALAALRPADFERPITMALSTSQFIGVASALAIAIVYWIRERAANADPASAMALVDDRAGEEQDDPEP